MLPWNYQQGVKVFRGWRQRCDGNGSGVRRAIEGSKRLCTDGLHSNRAYAGAGGLIIDWDTQTGYPAIWLRKTFWGRGYSAERASAIIELAFERLDLDLVAVPVQDGNDTSRRAVEKYIESHGGQYDGIVRNATVRPDGNIIDHHRYTVSNEQYQQTTNHV